MTDAAAVRRVYAKMLLATVFWGATFMVGRFAAQNLSPVTIGWYRYTVATLVLCWLTVRAEGRMPRLDRRQFWWTAALGLIGVTIYNLLFFGALERIAASRSALLVTLNPIVTAIVVALFFGERMRPIRWFGIALAFVGTVVVITRGDFSGSISDALGVGEMMSIGSTLCWVVYTLIARYAIRGLTPLAATAYASLWGWVGLTPLFLAYGTPFEAATFTPLLVGAVLYLAVLSTALPLVWYFEGLLVIGPARTAVFSNVVPIFGAGLGVALLGEPLLASMIIGGLITFVGVMLANRQ
ncbi:MAG: DMT family transporter [Burkholderiales bacterium]